MTRNTPTRVPQKHRSLASWFPFALALVIGCQLAWAAYLALALTAWINPWQLGIGWLKAAAVGQCVLAAISLGMVIARVMRPAWRRGLTAAWTIVAVEVGWFLVTRALTGR